MKKDVKFIIEKLNKSGFEAYIVGGCVRDKFMNKEPHDYDICTSALPTEVMTVFNGFKIIETGLKHGTVTLVLNNDNYEITTFRCDGEYLDGRHPETVKFVRNLKEDLMRRDFTMNAIAFDGKNTEDPFGGVNDINSKLIRCVGNADDRFNEDALRILRAIRFSSQLSFNIEKETEAAMFRNKELIKKVSSERIATEFSKILLGENVFNVLTKYKDIISVFVPEIKETFDFNQQNDWHIFNVYEHICHTVEKVPKDIVLRLTMFLHDIGKPQCFSVDENNVGHFYGHPVVSAKIAKNILKRLKFPNEIIENVDILVYNHDRQIIPSKTSVRKLLNKFSENNAKNLILVKRADMLSQNPVKIANKGCLEELDKIDCLIEEIASNGDCVRIKDLAINGNDLRELGYTPSPIFKTILDFALLLVIEGKVKNDKELLIKEVLNNFEVM